MTEAFKDKAVATDSSDPVVVKILDDDYSAGLFVPDNLKEFPSLKQVYLAVENAKVTYGINDKAIDNLVARQITGQLVAFAEGKLPIDGGSAKLIWNVGAADGQPPVDISDQVSGKANNTALFGRVSKGQQILTKMPATEGEEGITVFGASKASSGSDIEIPKGEGTYLSKDGLTLLAANAGIAAWSGADITVSAVKHIKGSVDSSTGDVKVEGSVYIEKDVRAGFRVEAVGDIFIGGNVEGADVYSRSGNVVVRNGIIGQSRARILAGNRILAGFIQDATIGAKLDVETGRYIFNSAVTAGRYILALKREGLVRGGTQFAGKKIEIRTAGNEARIETELKVGFTLPDSELKAHSDLRSEQRRNRMELAYVQKRIQFLTLLKQNKNTLAEDKEAQLVELTKKEKVLLAESQVQAKKESELTSEATDTSDPGEVESIRIHDKLHQGVSLFIGDVGTTVKKDQANIMFFRVGESIKFGTLNRALRKT
ncbi:MAG: DUF342 domain-containing protein [Candidatus Marinimicrobia bacterium]|nr:DUF342 domain-containing protein [Candidatus Neomarinimicrobiota bacterium]